MASQNPTLSRAVIDYARACQHPADAQGVAAARANLAAAKIEAFIEKSLVDAPPLTDDQRRRIASILARGGAK